MKRRVPAAVVALLASAVVYAHASTITMTVNYGATTSSEPGITGTLVYNGDAETITDPNGYTTVSGDFSSDWDAGSYPGNGDWIGLQNDDFMTFTFSAPMEYVGINWGTPDNYNFLTLYDGSTEIGSYTGSDIGSAGYVNFTPSAGEEITSVTLFSDSCCFETNGLSYELAAPSAVPEPTPLPLLCSGLIVFAILVRRRLSSASAV